MNNICAYSPSKKCVFSCKIVYQNGNSVKARFWFATTHVCLLGTFLKILRMLAQGLFFWLLRETRHCSHLNSLHVFCLLLLLQVRPISQVFFPYELHVLNFRYILFFLIVSEINWKQWSISPMASLILCLASSGIANVSFCDLSLGVKLFWPAVTKYIIVGLHVIKMMHNTHI